MSPRTISQPDPTPTQVRVFAVLLPVFFLLLGLMAIRRPHGLVVAAGVCTAATIVAVVLEKKNRAANLIGLSIPLLLMLIALPVKMGTSPQFVAATCVAIGVSLGVIALLNRQAGFGIYDF